MNEQQIKIIEILTGDEFGGNLWEKYGKRRIYFDSGLMCSFAGLDWSTYKTGNVSSASYKGDSISNGECKRIFEALHTWNFKLWLDLDDGKLYAKGKSGITNYRAQEIVQTFIDAVKEAIQ